MLVKRLKNDGQPQFELNEIQRSMKLQLENKIKSGEYNFETISSCIICSSEKKKLIGKKDRYGLEFTVNICKNCGFTYTGPRMTEQSYNSFYNIEYRKLYGGQETADINFYENQLNQGRLIHKYLSKNGVIDNKKLSILEVGCGAGGILGYFKSKGHTIKGIDLGQEYIEYGKKQHNLDLETCTLGELNIENKPDLIIYSHVMEHVLDLYKELLSIKKFCHQNTVVYIEVPGLKDIHRNYRRDISLYLQNAHTYHFTLTSLKNIFYKNEFRFLFGNEYVRAAFKQSNEPSKITKEYNKLVKYLLYQEKTRFLGAFALNEIKIKLKRILGIRNKK
jgi:2-polyprenyl-3-methyl-5-hydroxy-6-metoxy-1,4-benzoquinol methylase